MNLLKKEEGITVVSFFDGMSCGLIALKRLGIKVKKYYAFEIDKFAIKVSKANHPEIKHMGNVLEWRNCDIPWEGVDLVLGGSPCQGFSFSGKQLAFNDPRSKLFFIFMDMLNFVKLVNPEVKFLLENVRMKKSFSDVITRMIGADFEIINSSLVSAQNRVRYYWTNIKGLTQPTDKGIFLDEILESGEVDRDKSYCLDANYFKGINVKSYLTKSRRQIVWMIPEATKKGFVEVSPGQGIDLTFIRSKTRRGRLMLRKSNCLTATSHKYCVATKDWFRVLTPVECERLQTVPDNYTNYVSNRQRYKMLGNGWTIDVICHILKSI